MDDSALDMMMQRYDRCDQWLVVPVIVTIIICILLLSCVSYSFSGADYVNKIRPLPDRKMNCLISFI